MNIDGNTTLDQLAEHMGISMADVLNMLVACGPPKSIDRRILAVLKYRSGSITASALVKMIDPVRRQMVYQHLSAMSSRGQIKRISHGRYASLS